MVPLSVVFLLGRAYALRYDAYVRVDLLYGHLGERSTHKSLPAHGRGTDARTK